MKKVIQTRYQYWAPDNTIAWTAWYVSDPNHYDDDQIKAIIEQCQERVKPIEKSTRLLYEFRPYDADEFEKEYRTMLSDISRQKKINDRAREKAKEQKRKEREKEKERKRKEKEKEKERIKQQKAKEREKKKLERQRIKQQEKAKTKKNEKTKQTTT